MKKTTKSSSKNPIYQLKITLGDSKPPIWRRVQVQSNVSLAHLHTIIQVAMGWSSSHLWEFLLGEVRYTDPEFLDYNYDEIEMENANAYRLSDVLRNEKDKIVYLYDYGDYWDHKIVLEKIVPAETGQIYPHCVTGKRCCPPEDCGGISGYYYMLECLSNPKDDEYESFREWAGEDFDPEYFDAGEINQSLRKIFSAG